MRERLVAWLRKEVWGLTCDALALVGYLLVVWAGCEIHRAVGLLVAGTGLLVVGILGARGIAARQPEKAGGQDGTIG
jgi:hypothetical protein